MQNMYMILFEITMWYMNVQSPKVFYLNEVLLDTRIFIIKPHILIHFVNLFIFFYVIMAFFSTWKYPILIASLAMFRLIFF